MFFTCCMGCGKCVWYSQAEGKKSGSRIRQSRMKPFRRNIRNPDFGATPKMVWQNPAQNRPSAQEIFRKNLLREFFGGESIMFQWLDAMAKARELQLSNEKITSVVRAAKHWDQKDSYGLCLEGWTIFNWFNSLAQARMMELNNEKIGCVVRQKKNRV